MSRSISKRANGDGSVYFDADAQRWVASTTDRYGKRHKRTATTQKLAKQRLRELQDEERQCGRVTSPQATLRDLMLTWKTRSLDASQCAPSTKTTKLWAYTRIERTLGSVRLVNLNADRIEAGLGAMAAEGLSRESIIKVRSVLNQICVFGVRRELLRNNPVVAVELPAGLPGTESGRALTTAQAQHLLDVSANDRLHALWVTMTLLGLRPGEALGLHWSDVDFDAGVLRIRHTLRVGQSGLEISEHLKTPKSRRTLTMPDPVKNALHDRRLLQALERTHAAEAWSRTSPNLVFTTLLGTPINPSNLRRHFRQLTESAGLGCWSPNELRHTAVSIMSASGLPLERIADVVGHDGTRMTARVYRHALSPSIDFAVEPMNHIFGSGAT